MEAECIACGARFEADSVTWARHRVSGVEADGYDGEAWYGRDGEPWLPEHTEEYEMQMGGVGTFGRCPTCVERIHRAEERAAEYRADVPPEWFDPDYAGERWDDDY